MFDVAREIVLFLLKRTNCCKRFTSGKDKKWDFQNTLRVNRHVVIYNHKKRKQSSTKNQNKIPQKTKIAWWSHLFIITLHPARKNEDMGYFKRTADAILKERLEAFGAILIEGPKWCGKTTTAEQVAKSVIKLQDPDMRDEYLAAAATKPSLLLKGAGCSRTVGRRTDDG